MDNESTIDLSDLTDAAQSRIEEEDPDEQCVFFAKKHGNGYRLHSVGRNQLDLLYAQGGMGRGWMRVKMLDEF